MPDTSHLDALQLHLSHERERLAKAKPASEKELRAVWVAQIEREIAAERKFLGLGEEELPDLSDDDLLAALAE